MSLLDKLEKLNASKKIALHMPGHKRMCDKAEYLKKLGAEYDITEIYDFDNLHKAEGVLKETNEKLKKYYESDNSFAIVNGSTAGILAGIRSAVKFGDTILMSRASHKSVYNAVELNGLKTKFIYTETDTQNGIIQKINLSDIEKNLDDISLVVITSPTYEGILSDLDEIVRLCHAKNVPVLVDCAHGAHYTMEELFPNGNRADIVVQSLHKVLPSLTQTAVLHVNGDMVDLGEVMRNLEIFQTSSPSYILMASIDSCIDYMTEKKIDLFKRLEKNYINFTKTISNMNNLAWYNTGDITKIIIDCSNSNINGYDLMKILRSEHNIELEMAQQTYILAIVSVLDSEEVFEGFAEALLLIDSKLNENNTEHTGNFDRQEIGMSIFEAFSKNKAKVTLDNAIGEISAEYVWLYPPGIPVLIPGEKINSGFIDDIRQMIKSSSNIYDSYDLLPDELVIINQKTF